LCLYLLRKLVIMSKKLKIEVNKVLVKMEQEYNSTKIIIDKLTKVKNET
jgi:hypothetical protein